MLHANPQISRPWASAVEWLHDELDRQRGVASQYNYSSWSPPAQSNENTNSFILERSQSAKNILQMAFELCPEEVSKEINERRDRMTEIDRQQEQEEPNDSEVEPGEDYQQSKNGKETDAETQSPTVSSTADEEAVNKVAEKIETLRMGPRQVKKYWKFNFPRISILFSKEHEIEESTILLADEIPDVDVSTGKIVNIQPSAPLQTEQKS